MIVREPRQEFHLKGSIRKALGLEESLFSIAGTVVTADVRRARELAHRLSSYRTERGHPNPNVRAGEIVALGLMDEVFHHMLAVYRAERGGNPLAEAYEALVESIGSDEVENTIRGFCAEFPPTSVYTGRKSVDEYLDETVEGLSGRERTLEELVLLRLTNENPAAGRYSDLFDDTELSTSTAYERIYAGIESVLSRRPAGAFVTGGATESILDVLRAPQKAHPHSLEDQLGYIRDRWGAFVGRFLTRLLRGMDVLKEESKVGAPPGGGPGPAEIYQYDDSEAEGFSPDTEWMPGVVLIAKSTLVWLHQLSERHGREIRTLDQVPDEELDTLASWGFNGLWLIGLWERSRASKRIKHLTGNPDAEASAYALYSYDIAEEIGGWRAYDDLRGRCNARGIRLASDMVPNHTGIDSPWVAEHPDWFIHLDYPPFPAYSFSGENLSGRDDAACYLEDHYFTREDAAVVFKHVDTSGRERYIYHGNDGTSMPWNDTAQLNYLDPDVRETVIQTILHVARNFPIIRFDAAMTLAKKHFRRLWYPEPGSGGDIASRGEHGLTREEFDRAMPKEFWREVVDRVAVEAPGTLLLAEAFWMMEGYFVRTLGMHRVYNSAFMNMLKREQNADYRTIIKETLTFDPAILGRFVNFMNNPDEETAVTQFGTGDKYFGVCTLLATLPGLPMFGHGQVEGLAEKYGMEFRRPYWDEKPDQGLIDRHAWEIFPLLRRRHVFASSAGFRLYDLERDGGGVDENVFAYSNTAGRERAVVVFNNSYERTAGRIRSSVPFVVKHDDGSREQRTESLGSALGLSRDEKAFCVFREQRSNLWFVRRAREVHDAGLSVALDGYQTSVILDVHERIDSAEDDLAKLERELGGRGVSNIDHAVLGLELRPARDAFAEVFSAERYRELDDAILGSAVMDEADFTEIRAGYRRFLDSLAGYRSPTRPIGIGITNLERHLSSIISLPHMDTSSVQSPAVRRAIGRYVTGLRDRPDRRRLFVGWLAVAPVVELYESPELVIGEWGLDGWVDFSDTVDGGHLRALLRAALRFPTAPHLSAKSAAVEARGNESNAAAALARALRGDEDVDRHIGSHEREETSYFEADRFAEVLQIYLSVGLIRTVSTAPLGGRTAGERIQKLFELITRVEEANEAAAGNGSRLEAILAESPKRVSAKKKNSARE